MAAARQQAPTEGFVSLKLNSFTSGAGFPEGIISLDKFMWHVWNYGQENGPNTLSCQITGTPATIDAKGQVIPAGEPIVQEYSAGSGAADAFSISPDGTKLIPIGSRSSLGKGSKFFTFLENLVSSGFPEESFDNDLSVFNGTVVRMHHIADTDRNNLPQSNLMPGAQPRGDQKRTVAVPNDVLKLPWEKTARKPGAAPAKAAAAPVARAAAPAPVAQAAPQAEVEEVPVEAGEGPAADLMTYLAPVLAGTKSLAKTQARVGVFTGMNKAKVDVATRDAAMKLFADDNELSNVLMGIGNGYIINGANIVEMA